MASFIKNRWKGEIESEPDQLMELSDETPSILNNTPNNTMFRNFEFTWENAFYSVLWLGFVAITTLFIFFVASTKYTHKYTLGGSSGTLNITKEIDWSPDETITLDRSIPYEQAIKMVDSLNQTLK